MTGLFFGLVLPIIVVAIILFARIAYEAKDKNYRRQNNLPARRYHDINDYDVYTVYTIHNGDDRRR